MLISLWLFVTPFITHAEDKYWVGGSGSWDDPNNWSVTEGGPGGAGPPAPGSLPASLDGENAYLIQSDANNNVVSYENPQESNSIGAMVIDATGTGTMTLSLSQGTLRTQGIAIGYNGTGIFNQTGGSNWTVSPQSWGETSFILGSNATGSGVYDLSEGELVTASPVIGGGGIGTFNQLGGTFEAYSGFQLGDKGTYNLSDGLLETTKPFVWEPSHEVLSGGSIFNQTGGTHWLQKGTQNHQFNGTYNLSGGMLSAEGGLYVAGTLNQSGGTVEAPLLNLPDTGGGGLYITGTYNLSGGLLTQTTPLYFAILAGFRNAGTFNYSGGSITISDPRPDPDPSFVGFNNSGTFNLSGSGTRTVEGNILNTGTVKTTHTTAVFNGTFTNNGAYISDPASQYFIDLIVEEAGYLIGQHNDQFYIGGDFINHSTMNNEWNTRQSYLGFIDGEDSLHNFYLTGVDYGATMSGYANNFAWGTLDVTDNYLTFYDGNSEEGAALYLRELCGLAISDDLIANLFGFDGLNVYYMAQLPGNSYLGGLTYELSGGGYLRPTVPEPSTILLLSTSLVALVGFRRKFGSKHLIL